MTHPNPPQRRLKLVLAVALGVCLGAGTMGLYCTRGERAEHLTFDRLLSVAVGDSAGEVVSKLGYPVLVKGSGLQWGAPLGHSDAWPEKYVWVYATPHRWLVHEGLAVYVSFQDGKVMGVYAKVDDFPHYWRPAPDGDRPEKLLRLRQAME
jgi:hypothetical protein